MPDLNKISQDLFSQSLQECLINLVRLVIKTVLRSQKENPVAPVDWTQLERTELDDGN